MTREVRLDTTVNLDETDIVNFPLPVDIPDDGGACSTRYGCCVNDKTTACVDFACSNCSDDNSFTAPEKKFGATARVADAANKSLSKENARLVRQVIGGLAGLTSAACVVTAYLGAEKARKEKSLLNKVLTGAAAAGTAAAAVEIAVQSYDLFMEREQQPELGE
jgi:hypothetical protein